jgi:DNA-binding Lrp family transcriptional regulator
VLAYVLITVQLGTMDDVLKALKQFSHVVEAYLLYGKYDVVAKIEAASTANLREIVANTIRRLENVRATQTLIVML